MKSTILLSAAFMATFSLGAQSLTGPQFTPSSAAFSTQDALAQPVESVASNIVATVRSVASGDFHDPATWDCGCVPGMDDSVEIMFGHYVSASNTLAVQDLLVASGGSFEALPLSLMTIRIGNVLDTQGEFSVEGQRVQFVGDGAHAFYGTSTLHDVTLDGSCELHGTMRLGGRLTMSDAHLVTNDQLIFGWHEGRMASLDVMNSGSIEGSALFMQQVDVLTDDWIGLGTMVSDATFATWDADFTTYGIPGGDYPGYGFQSIMHYDESLADEAASFIAPENIADAIVPTRGYYVYTAAGDFEIATSGEPVLGDQTFEVSYSDNGDFKHDGFNLLANPYPSAIHWDQDEGWTKVGVDAALYQWDAVSRQYRTYASGMALNGGSPIIEAGQAFIMHASNASCGLIVHEQAKTTETSVPTNGLTEQIHLVVSDLSGNYDELILGFDDNADAGYEFQRDALKLRSDTYHNIFTSDPSGEQAIGINILPKTEGDEIPVYLNAPAPTDFILTVAGAPGTAPDRCLAIEDMVTGDIIELVPGAQYSFFSGVVDDEMRFRVHVGQPISLVSTPITCAGINDASISVTGNGGGDLTYTWSQDETVFQIVEISGEASEVNDLGPGAYSITVDGNSWCDGLVTEVEILSVPAIEILETEVETPGCGETNTGSIAVLAQGGTGPLFYDWSNGLEAPVIEGLYPGTYYLDITDYNGCLIEQTFVIEDKVEVSAMIDVVTEVIEIQDGQAIPEIINLTTGATNFTWDMGDGTVYNEALPVHGYTSPGVYTIEMDASNEDCFGSASVSVIVNESSVGVNDLNDEGNAHVWLSENQLHVVLDLPTSEQVVIRVYNEVGQLVVSTGPDHLQNDHLTLDLPDGLHWALVDIRSLTTGSVARYKVAQ